MLLVSDTTYRTSDVYPGPRRVAIEELDRLISGYEESMNAALESGDLVRAHWNQQQLKGRRVERDELFTCSIHSVKGAYDGLS